jgi:hypothetical protein
LYRQDDDERARCKRCSEPGSRRGYNQAHMDSDELTSKLLACQGDVEAMMDVMREAGLLRQQGEPPSDMERIVDAAMRLASRWDGAGGPEWRNVIAESGVSPQIAASLRDELLRYVDVPESQTGLWRLKPCLADLAQRAARLRRIPG